MSRTPTPKPACKELRTWLSLNTGTRIGLGALTGTDSRALAAAVHSIELYSISSDAAALQAFALLVRCMQPSTREFAYHAIAYVMDWSDRARLWDLAGLPPFSPALSLGGDR